ncbi:protein DETOXIFICATION 28 [Brassica napus]|uniref:protein DETOXIFICATION 28 n=1 Tax=Brassica napus TaxID=3708 RepID=UPI000BBF2BEF|nr:protein DETOXIFICATION 28 [Brassica napus]
MDRDEEAMEYCWTGNIHKSQDIFILSHHSVVRGPSWRARTRCHLHRHQHHHRLHLRPSAPILQFLGQPEDIAQLSGTATVLTIPLHFAFVFVCPINRFLQCQLKNEVLAITAGATLVVHIFVSWLFVYGLKLGFIWTMITFTLSWWLNAIILFVYIVWGGCPLTWTGFSMEAFMGLWEYAKLSASSGIMLWY